MAKKYEFWEVVEMLTKDNDLEFKDEEGVIVTTKRGNHWTSIEVKKGDSKYVGNLTVENSVHLIESKFELVRKSLTLDKVIEIVKEDSKTKFDLESLWHKYYGKTFGCILFAIRGECSEVLARTLSEGKWYISEN